MSTLNLDAATSSDGTIPQAPGHIKRNPRAYDKWLALWPALDRTRINPVTHVDFVCQYCQAYADMRDAQEQLEKGKLVKDKQDRVWVNPYQAIYDNSVKQIAELGKMLGLRPDMPMAPISRYEDYAEILRSDDNGDCTDTVSGEPGAA